MQLRAVQIPYEREVVLPELKPRRWRWDFVLRDHLLLVEVQGAIYTGGRHARGAGIQADMDKSNAATLAGWRVLSVSTDDVVKGRAISMVERAVGR